MAAKGVVGAENSVILQWPKAKAWGQQRKSQSKKGPILSDNKG